MRIWPNATDEERSDILWGATAFPFDDPEGTARQLQDMFDKSGGDVQTALMIADEETCEEMEHADEWR